MMLQISFKMLIAACLEGVDRTDADGARPSMQCILALFCSPRGHHKYEQRDVVIATGKRRKQQLMNQVPSVPWASTTRGDSLKNGVDR
jgi:hypothetical protein